MQGQVEENQMIFHLIYHILVFLIEALIILLVVFGITYFCRGSYQFCYEIFGSVSSEEEPGADKKFIVKDSDTMYRVAGRLEDEKLIVNKNSFYIRTMLMNQEQIKLRSGSYVLNTSMDYEEIINELTMSE